MSNFKPTAEQQQAIDLAIMGGNLAIEAYAGAGKTSTLRMVADAKRDTADPTGQYVAFNRSIVDEAKNVFPSTVRCSTAHGLAMQAVGKAYRDRVFSGKRITAWQTADRLGLETNDNLAVFDFDLGGETMAVEFGTVKAASIASQTVRQFCMTADREIDYRHVPFQLGIDAPGEYVNNKRLQALIVPLARKMWSELLDPNGDEFRFEHSHYLKMWELSGPVIPADFVLIDEAQDLNPLMRSIMDQQDAQLIWVGDSFQQIYGWNGAVNALGEVEVENRCRLTESFRFGEAIAEQANVVLDRLGAPAKLTGVGPEGTVGPLDRPDVYLGRTNAGVLATAFGLMDKGIPVMVNGGVDQIVRFAEAAQRLQNGEPANHPELSCFKTWSAVCDYVEEGSVEAKELATSVFMVESFGADEIIERMGQTAKRPGKDVRVVSTAHKSKGCEWGNVELLGDYALNPGDEDLRLLYVAATRAKVGLDRQRVDLEGTQTVDIMAAIRRLRQMDDLDDEDSIDY